MKGQKNNIIIQRRCPYSIAANDDLISHTNLTGNSAEPKSK